MPPGKEKIELRRQKYFTYYESSLIRQIETYEIGLNLSIETI